MDAADPSAVEPSRSEWRTRLRALPVFGSGVPGTDESSLPAHPMELVARWLDEAIEAGIAQPHVASLATATPEGAPSVRMLLVKDLDAGGIWFSSSSRSAKGLDLAANPRAALTLYWRETGRQLRLEGAVDAPSSAVSAADFRERHPLARRELLAGEPSRPRHDADERLAAAQRRLEEDPEVIAPDWTAYRLRPDAVDVWTAQPDGSNLRVHYLRDGEEWRHERYWG